MKFLPKKFPMNEQYEKLPLFADGVIWLEFWNVRGVRYPLFMAKISPAFNINSGILRSKGRRPVWNWKTVQCPPLSFIASILYSKGVLAIDFWWIQIHECNFQWLYEYLFRLTEWYHNGLVSPEAFQTLHTHCPFISRASKWVWQFSIRVKNVLQLENETLCLSLNSPFLFLFAISISLQKLLASFYDKCDKVIWLLPWKAMAFSAILKIIASGNSILEIS